MQIPCGIIPKYRRKAFTVRCASTWAACSRVATAEGCEIGEGHLMVDHVHRLLSIPPKYFVSQVMGI